MNRRSAKSFYVHQQWDEPAWIDVVSIEYRQLIESYPFASELAQAPGDRLLDVGCGTAIFPSLLDPTLEHSTHLQCDLLDISQASLRGAADVLHSLNHFTPRRRLKTAIEHIPRKLPIGEQAYDVIWAIHSFTTVEIDHMAGVYEHLWKLLTPGGRLYVYQLAAPSSYQKLYGYYRQRHPDQPPFMTFEDSQRLLGELTIDFRTHPTHFQHEIPLDQPELLDNYLRKCVLDSSLEALDFFGPLLPDFQDGNLYRFPQSVNLITITRSAP